MQVGAPHHEAACVALVVHLGPLPVREGRPRAPCARERHDASDGLHGLRALVGSRAQPLEDPASMALEQVEDLGLRDAELVLRLARAAALLLGLRPALRGARVGRRAAGSALGCPSAAGHAAGALLAVGHATTARLLNVPREVVGEEDVGGQQGRHGAAVDLVGGQVLEQHRQVCRDHAGRVHVLGAARPLKPLLKQREDLLVEPSPQLLQPRAQCLAVGRRLPRGLQAPSKDAPAARGALERRRPIGRGGGGAAQGARGWPSAGRWRRRGDGDRRRWAHIVWEGWRGGSGEGEPHHQMRLMTSLGWVLGGRYARSGQRDRDWLVRS